MQCLEKEVEDYVAQIINSYPLGEVNTFFEGHAIQQFQLGQYGIADILIYNVVKIQYPGSYERKVNICICEIKKDAVDLNTVAQALKYKAALSEYLQSDFLNFEIFILLIGNSVSIPDDSVFILNEIYNLQIQTYSLSFETGISFKVFFERGSFYTKAKNSQSTRILNRFSFLRNLVQASKTFFYDLTLPK